MRTRDRETTKKKRKGHRKLKKTEMQTRGTKTKEHKSTNNTEHQKN